MKRLNLLVVFLVLSLLLNGFFLGGYWIARLKATKISNSKQRISEIARLLDLTPEQKKKFLTLKKRAIGIRRPYLEQMARLRSQFWKKVVNNPDAKEDLEKIIHEMAVKREEYQRKIAGIICEFLQILDQKQKKKFLEISRKNRMLKALISG